MATLKDCQDGSVLEKTFLNACKTGEVDVVKDCILQGVNINCSSGWPLRRAVRYHRDRVWRYLLSFPDLEVNLVNTYGMSGLHTAARFGNGPAVSSLLASPLIHPNLRTKTGATALMVATKYLSRSAVEILIKDQRVDLGCVDEQNRNVLQVAGVALVHVDESLRTSICEVLRLEMNRRATKRRKLEAVHPEQILVRHAREKLNKLISDLEDSQRLEMVRFQENSENDKKTFQDKQSEEKENFTLKIEEEERLFLYNQDVQRSKFLSRMSRRKFQFERMQQEAGEEFLDSEKRKLEDFKDKQSRQKETLLISQKSNCEDREEPISKTSLERKLCKSLGGSVTDIAAEIELHEDRLTRPHLTPCDQPLVSDQPLISCYTIPGAGEAAAGPVASILCRKLSCPPRMISDPLTVTSTPPPSPVNLFPRSGQRSCNSPISDASLNPSPVPSLEFIPSHSDLAASIPDTCPNIKALLALKVINPAESDDDLSVTQSPVLHHNYLTYPWRGHTTSELPPSFTTKSTPRLSRKNTMEVVREESDDESPGADTRERREERRSLVERGRRERKITRPVLLAAAHHNNQSSVTTEAVRLVASQRRNSENVLLKDAMEDKEAKCRVI